MPRADDAEDSKAHNDSIESEANENWLLLTDFASKYRISVSTLRRRIKNEQIRHRFEDGKYYLLDETPAPALTIEDLRAQALSETENAASAKRLVGELKTAYTGVLQEKEQQIIQLKEEVSDLKTLVRVLESENERLRRFLGGGKSPGGHA